MDKYYLLVFNEDYIDEHNVPALACMTQEEYNEWLDTSLVRDNYESDEEWEKVNKEFQDKVQEFNTYTEFLDSFYQKHKRLASSNEAIEAGIKPCAAFMSKDNAPKRFTSILNAYLGNSGDYFEEGYEIYKNGKAFVEAGIVKVTEVDKSFYDYFHKANLSSLSLCNIFTTDY